MLRSKYFRVAMLILVPFVVLWIMEGIGWAIAAMATFVVASMLFLFTLGDNKDEEIYITRRQVPPRSDIQGVANWHIPSKAHYLLTNLPIRPGKIQNK